MGGVRLSILKSLCKSTSCSYAKFGSYQHIRPAYAFLNRSYHSKETQSLKTFANTHSRALGSESLANIQSYRTKPISAFSPTLSNSHIRSATPLFLVNPILNSRSYSSSVGSNADKAGQPGLGVPAASGGSEVDIGNSGIVGSDWVAKVKDAWQSAVDAATYSGQKAKETSVELSPYVQQLLDSYPHLRNVVVPVGCTLAGTIFAWLVMPRLFRRFHKYASQGRTALLSGSLSEVPVPYEKSFWGALEDPVRYLVTFMAFSQMLVVSSSKICFIITLSLFVYMHFCFPLLNNEEEFYLQWHAGSTDHYSFSVSWTGMERCSYPFICVVSASVEDKCVHSCISDSKFAWS